MSMRRYLLVVLICIFVMMSDDGHVFMRLSATCTSSFRGAYSGLLPTFRDLFIYFLGGEGESESPANFPLSMEPSAWLHLTTLRS